MISSKCLVDLVTIIKQFPQLYNCKKIATNNKTASAFAEAVLEPILNFDVELFAVAARDHRIQRPGPVFPVVRVQLDGLPVALVSFVVAVQTHEDLALQGVPAIVPGVGPQKLTEGAFQIALLHQAEGEVLGFLLGDQIKPDPALGGQLQRLLVGQIESNQLILRLLLALCVRKLIRMAFLYLAAVRGPYFRRVRAGPDAQHFKWAGFVQTASLPALTGSNG